MKSARKPAETDYKKITDPAKADVESYRARVAGPELLAAILPVAHRLAAGHLGKAAFGEAADEIKITITVAEARAILKAADRARNGVP